MLLVEKNKNLSQYVDEIEAYKKELNNLLRESIYFFKQVVNRFEK